MLGQKKNNDNNNVGSTHVVEQLLFSMLPLIMPFYFHLLLGLFLTFGPLMGYFGVGVGFKNCFVVYSST